MHTICLDCGASFLKGALLKDGKILRQVQRPAPHVTETEILVPRQVEKLVKLARDIISLLAKGLDEATLAIANEMHGFLLAWKDGSPCTDYISWQKEFGRLEVAGESAVRFLGQEIFRDAVCSTGMPLRAGLPSSNLLYLKKRGVLPQKEEVYFFVLGDYLLYRLSGSMPVCHPSNAAATGLYDLTTDKWQKQLVDAVTTDGVILPEVHAGASFTEFTFEGTKITAVPTLGDQQASLCGAGLSFLGEISFNLGTGAQVSTLLPAGDLSELFADRKYQIRPYLEGRYIKTIPHLPSGRALNVYFRFVKSILEGCGYAREDEDIWKDILDAAAKAESGDLAVDLSFFENPVTNQVMGSIKNISEKNLVFGGLFASVFRQMGNNFLWAAGELGIGTPRKIIFSGGVARKIKQLRGYIENGMGCGTETYVAKNEAMYGLCKYAQMMTR
ncbi:MAG: hypothetical protein IJU00_08765 [Selenomonas sp.]|nr:hypothetical protein [Selenomonas sp.]